MNLEDEEILEKAIKLQNANRHKNALKILHTLESKYSKYSPLNGLIASSYYQTNDFEKSSKYFKKTLKLNPNSELASLGLFHSLLEIGKHKIAFTEMDRFLSANIPKPNLYKVTISEMHKNLERYPKSFQNIITKHFLLL